MGCGGRLDRVADRAAVARRPLVGRAVEIAAVVELVDAATRGDGGALMVFGEAGVGKTAMVHEASDRVDDLPDVLWAPCLPLTSLAVPFLPLTTALRGWAAESDVPVPVLGESGEEGPTGFDTWLEAVCRQHPVLLVVDDLQWADQSTLDVLMYVLAGLVGRRLAVVTTVRAGEEGEPLRRWLADVRRFPGVSELTLGRLDRVATAEQLAGLLGRPPHQSLVDDVYGRSDGNAYLTSLLVRGLSPDARSLPAGLPTDLQEAATGAWRGLSAPAHDLTALIAVAGRPQRADQLGAVAAATGVGGDLVALLREAVDAAVLDVGEDGSYWFVHPLLAEVLEADLLPEERTNLHAAFAAALEATDSTSDLGVEAVVALADHHHQARHPTDAFRWALRGAEAAERVGGATEMLRLLRRALDLWPSVPDPGVPRLDLLQRIRAAAERTGEQEQELVAIEDLLAIVESDADPLITTELLVRRFDLHIMTGRTLDVLEAARYAFRISVEHPSSAEHALAVAVLAQAELWQGEPSGPARVHEAIRLARVCGSAKALAYALIAKVTARVFAGDAGGLAEAMEAQAAAAKVTDYFTFVDAALWASDCLGGAASRDAVEHLRLSRQQMSTFGAPHCYVAWLSAIEAQRLLMLGDVRNCAERLRVALGSTPGRLGDATARLTAAQLACRQGRLVDAEAHLARAEELFSNQWGYLALPFDVVRAELAVAIGDTERAIMVALSGLEWTGPRLTQVERLIPLAARALADYAQARRDRGEDPARAVDQLVGFRRRYPFVVVNAVPGSAYHAQVRAMQAWYDAEVQRGRADPTAATAWHRAAQACAEGNLAWDEAYAWWRAAEALAKDRTARDAATTALRRAHWLAVELQAAPLLAEIEELAQSARVSLDIIDEGTLAETAGLPGLTAREREVLAHVVAGRTYGEIARELVISQKTVSVHVSNLLRKTGTANRVELAQLARRRAKPGGGVVDAPRLPADLSGGS